MKFLINLYVKYLYKRAIECREEALTTPEGSDRQAYLQAQGDAYEERAYRLDSKYLA